MTENQRQPTDRQRPTVATIAARAGVSIGTVSKVLHGQGQLRPETRERVLAAAEALGATRSPAPHRSAGVRTYTVGVLTTDHIGRFTIPILEGAEDTLGAGQMAMILCASRGDAIREQHYLRSLVDRRVDGIIVTGRASDIRPSLGRDFPVPVVYALTQSDDPGDLSILHDDEQGAQLAVTHLLETGRRNVCHIGGPTRHVATANRWRGTQAALAESGTQLALGQPLFGEWSEQWGREAAQRVLRSGEQVDGIFCGSDQIARGVLDALRESGRNVPAEIAVVGVDNWDVMVTSSRPTLTSVDLNLPELGRRAAARLLAAINGEPLVGGIELVPCQLIRRGSTELV